MSSWRVGGWSQPHTASKVLESFQEETALDADLVADEVMKVRVGTSVGNSVPVTG